MISILRRSWLIVGLALLPLSLGAATLAENDVQGTLDLTCSARSAALTDAITCHVTIDEMPQLDAALDQATSYLLDPGEHTVLVELAGEQAGLFDPAYQQQTVKIAAGRTTRLRATFTKKGHLLLSLDQPAVVADFLIDGEQVATQSAIFDTWIKSGVSHKVEARNLADPAADDVYTWKDAQLYIVARAGADRKVTFKLRKQYLKGFLAIRCRVSGLSGASCLPAIDGIQQPAIDAGTTARYTLDPGSHSVVVTPGPDGSWRPASVTRTVRIRAGVTQTIYASFVTAQPSAAQPEADRLPVLTMGGCNSENRGYRWGPPNLAALAGFESKNLMMTEWAPPECWPASTDPTHPPRKLTVAECAVFYYKPLTLVLFPNRPFDGNAYYDDVAKLIRHIENYENEIGISHAKKVVMGPVSYEGGVIGSPNTVIALGAGVVDLPDIIQKTRDTTGFMAATDNVHLVVSPYFFGIVDTVVRKAMKGSSGMYTIEPTEIPPYTP
jgi:hypothetical protein